MSTGFNNTYPAGTTGAGGNLDSNETLHEFLTRQTRGLPQNVDMNSLPGWANFTTLVSTVRPAVRAAQEVKAGSQRIRTPEWQVGRIITNQFIPDNFNPTSGTFMMASFTAQSGGVVNYLVYVCPDYHESYVFKKTLDSLGFEPIIANIRRSRNPRGGRLQPVGVAGLFMKLSDNTSFVNCLVLAGEPGIDAGVLFILGKHDIDRLLGANWTPAQRL